MGGAPRVLVLGATGRLGRALRLVWDGSEVEPIWQGRGTPQDWAGAARGAVAVVDLAGVTRAADPAAFDENPRLAGLAAQVAQALGARLFLISSAAVYGDAPGPQHEDGPAVPVSDYGRSKLAAEGAGGVALRLGNVAGADLLGRAMARGPVVLDVFADGRGPRRSYIGPVSFARVLAGLIRHPGPLPRVLNVAAPGVVAMDALLDAAGHPWTGRPAPATARARLEMDAARLSALGLAPPPADPVAMMAEVADLTARGWA